MANFRFGPIVPARAGGRGSRVLAALVLAASTVFAGCEDPDRSPKPKTAQMEQPGPAGALDRKGE